MIGLEFFKNHCLSSAGFGVVIRNHLGLVLASMTNMDTLPPSIDMAECMAAARVFRFASDCGFSSVILEGDSKIVFKALSCDNVFLSLFSNLVDEIKSLAKNLRIVTFSHTHTQSNSITHNLTKRTRHVSGLQLWMENVSPHLIFVILADFG